jgi:3-methyladenine DNA glycosylase Tag
MASVYIQARKGGDGSEMNSFKKIFEMAASNKGGVPALEAMLTAPMETSELLAIPDDRWLSTMTKCIFQAGFNWKVVDSMWQGFEEAFEGFDPGYCAMLNPEDLERLVSDTRIVRHGAKIKSVQDNASMLLDLKQENGTPNGATVIANWPNQDYVGLLALLKKRGSRLGGTTGQYFLRFMGKSSFIFSRDVVSALVREKVIDTAPTSKKAQTAT